MGLREKFPYGSQQLNIKHLMPLLFRSIKALNVVHASIEASGSPAKNLMHLKTSSLVHRPRGFPRHQRNTSTRSRGFKCGLCWHTCHPVAGTFLWGWSGGARRTAGWRKHLRNPCDDLRNPKANNQQKFRSDDSEDVALDHDKIYSDFFLYSDWETIPPSFIKRRDREQQTKTASQSEWFF